MGYILYIIFFFFGEVVSTYFIIWGVLVNSFSFALLFLYWGGSVLCVFFPFGLVLVIGRTVVSRSVLVEQWSVGQYW